MENDKYVPYLKHINEGGTAINQGTRKNPNFLYTSHGGRNKSVIYHTEEEGKLYQYHKSSVNRDEKNFKSKVSGTYFLNPDLLYIWRVLSGWIFFNLCDENILNVIITFLHDCHFLIDENLRPGFSEFKNYLLKYYFSAASPSNPGNFDYYYSILMEGYMTSSTNCLESLNIQLIYLSGSGFLAFNRTCGVIKDFKVHFMQLHEEKIVNDQINKRK